MWRARGKGAHVASTTRNATLNVLYLGDDFAFASWGGELGWVQAKIEVAFLSPAFFWVGAPGRAGGPPLEPHYAVEVGGVAL